MKQPTWIDHPTSNLSPRGGKRPQAIVLHHTGGHLQGDLATLCNRRDVGSVSADFLVARDGTIYKLNPQLGMNYTWHAGVSKLDGLPRKNNSINVSTIGIEMCHAESEDWPEAQIKACAMLCRWLEETDKVIAHRIVSHAEVALPKGRKNDPKGFPWMQFQALYQSAVNE